MNRGFIILVVPKDKLNALVFKPKQQITSDDDAKTAITFFRNWLFEFPDSMVECKKHFQALYKSLPRTIAYYYGIEVHYDMEGQIIRRFCYPIGVGDNEVDALSTHFLDSHVSMNLETGFKKDGHFVKATFMGDDLSFEPIQVANYSASLRFAHQKSREKLERIARSLPISNTPLPDDFRQSLFWTNVIGKYQRELEDQRIKEYSEKLNADFKKAEDAFHDGVKKYKEYKRRLADANRNTAMISLILQGVSIAADIHAQQSYQASIKTYTDNQSILSGELNKLEAKLFQQKDDLQNMSNQIYRYFRNNHIPINDEPVINIDWNDNLY